ncbi:aminoglycoside phosphotransferase family protein [Candidatus Pacearchaeota archaeon]|nr:aminoglycoside phosphotransferase family protein [Candidatus Pacearchaeota archaeon]
MKKEIEKYLEKQNPLNFSKNEKTLEVKKIARGESNINFLIGTSRKKYLIRFDIVNDVKRFKHEYDILKKIEHLNISPKPLFIDLSKKHFADNFMIQTFIEGKSLDKLDKKIYLPYCKKIAKNLARLHKEKINFKNKTYSFEKRLIRTKKIIRQLKRNIKQFSEKETILKLIKIYEDTLKNKLKKYNQKLSFCHGDVCLGNVMFKDKEFFLIDWELAGNLDPAIEISYHLYEFPYTRKQKDTFVKEYLNEKKDAGLRKRMEFSNFFVAFSGYLDILHTCFNIANKKGHKEFLESANLKEYWEWGDYYLDFVVGLGLLDKSFEKRLKKDLNKIYERLK